MSIIKISLFILLIIGVILLTIFLVLSFSETKIITLECSPEFWENNIELWKTVGLDHNDDFDKTFGKDYFDPNITLEQAIKREGVGMNHLARSGTAAYLNALADAEIDEENIRGAVNLGYVHQLDNYLANCNEIKKEVSILGF